MASSKESYPVWEPERFYWEFPHLNDKNHAPTSHATPNQKKPTKPYSIYNCFAFVVGDRKRFWWPDYPYSYWPKDRAPNTVEELMRVLQQDFGYQPCDNGNFENGVQKVAIFYNDTLKEPVHIAIQPSNRRGEWMSKMAYNIDMKHDLHAVETHEGDESGQGFGKIVRYMKLVRKGR